MSENQFCAMMSNIALIECTLAGHTLALSRESNAPTIIFYIICNLS